MDIQRFKRNSQRSKKPLQAFLKKFDEIVPEDFPKLVAETDKSVWANTNCLECAHCCKTMTPTFNRTDISRISKHLGMKPKEFVSKWLKRDPDNGDWVNVLQPCQFLRPDNMCAIYEVRPKDCAEFPHHNKKPFDDYNETFSNNVEHCPATYELVKRLKQRVEKEYNWE